jgi:acyl phosphate:glycerol-3-phosphate acyltransferase
VTGGWVALAIVVGYLVGSISPAALIARARGLDLRHVGSGNPGATNAARAMGGRIGLVVGLLDVVKGFLPAIVFVPVSLDAGMAAGAAAVMGHVTSPWLKGRGGRGVATSFGAVLAVEPVWALIILAVFAVVLAGSRWVAGASVAAAAALVVVALVYRTTAWQLVWAGFLAFVVELRHVPNIVRRYRARSG